MSIGIDEIEAEMKNGGSDSKDDSDDYCMEDLALYAVEVMGDALDSDMNLVKVTDTEHDYESYDEGPAHAVSSSEECGEQGDDSVDGETDSFSEG